MPILVFASSKGGVGKSTSTITLAGELARANATVGLIDADPNQHVARWATKSGCPANIFLIPNSTESTILDDIETASARSAFVLVDLEGTASLAVANAISQADMVIIPCQFSDLDAEEAVKTIKLIKRQERILKRSIKYAMLMTRVPPAIRTRTAKDLMTELDKAGVERFQCSLIDREAFRAVHSYGGPIHELDPKKVPGVDKATKNARLFASEVIARLKGNEKEAANG